MRYGNFALALVATLLTGACTLPQPPAPFVLDSLRYSWSARGGDVTERATNERRQREVVVCYHRKSATRRDIFDLAAQTCAKNDVLKSVRLVEQLDEECPLLTPAKAVFECFDPNPARTSWTLRNKVQRDRMPARVATPDAPPPLPDHLK